MKVKILNVTDLQGNPKEERIWETERIIIKSHLKIGNQISLIYPDGEKYRITTSATDIHIEGTNLTIKTKNSIYNLQIIY